MGEKERVGCMERETWKIALPCEKYTVNGNLLNDSGNSNRGFVSTERGGMGRKVEGRFSREGIYVYLWLIHAEV